MLGCANGEVSGGGTPSAGAHCSPSLFGFPVRIPYSQNPVLLRIRSKPHAISLAPVLTTGTGISLLTPINGCGASKNFLVSRSFSESERAL